MRQAHSFYHTIVQTENSKSEKHRDKSAEDSNDSSESSSDDSDSEDSSSDKSTVSKRRKLNLPSKFELKSNPAKLNPNISVDFLSKKSDPTSVAPISRESLVQSASKSSKTEMKEAEKETNKFISEQLKSYEKSKAKKEFELTETTREKNRRKQSRGQATFTLKWDRDTGAEKHGI